LIDPNGGSAITVLEKLFKRLGVKTKIINNKLGQFSRLIEPNITSLSYLSGQVSEGGFTFGCGFDCDADRVEFVLPEQMVSGQYVLALACDAYLRGTKNQIVVVNDCTSYLVSEVIKKYGAKVKEVEVGETNVVEAMEKEKSIIGGEGSNGGVIVFPIKCRDGIMTTVLIIKLIAELGKSLSTILDDYPKYYTERTIKNCLPDRAVWIKSELEEYFRQKGYNIKKTGGKNGGLKILIDKNNFLWFRSSKTEMGIFRIIADGDNRKLVKELLKDGEKMFDELNK
jgi:phosphomannomutase